MKRALNGTGNKRFNDLSAIGRSGQPREKEVIWSCKLLVYPRLPRITVKGSQEFPVSGYNIHDQKLGYFVWNLDNDPRNLRIALFDVS